MLQPLSLEQFQGGRYAEDIVLRSGEGTAEDRVVVLLRNHHPEPHHDGGSRSSWPS